jgi:hypothetical protein
VFSKCTCRTDSVSAVVSDRSRGRDAVLFSLVSKTEYRLDALSTNICKAYAVAKWMSVATQVLWEVQKKNQRFLFEEYIFWESGKYSVAVYCPRDSNVFISYGLWRGHAVA